MSEDSQPDSNTKPACGTAYFFQCLCVSSMTQMALALCIGVDLVQKPSRVCWWIWSAYRRAAQSGDERLPRIFQSNFPATDQTNNAEFKVTIQRDDLSYRLEGAKLAAMLGDSTPARLAGRCSILDGRGF